MPALGLGLSVHLLSILQIKSFIAFNITTEAYKTRTLEEGFTLEALDCVDAITSTFN